MSAWLAATIIVTSVGSLEAARRAWKHRRPFSIEQIGTSLATARAKQSRLPGTSGADRAPGLSPDHGSTVTAKLPVAPGPDAEHRDQAQH